MPAGDVHGSSISAPSSLLELTATSSMGAEWLVNLVAPQVGGGKWTSTDLDAIENRPDATALRVSGLDQSTFEILVSRYGRGFTALHFWKCPRIEDFSPLESLPSLTYVSVYWNQRASRLWDLRKTPNLVGLEFEDFTRLRTIDDLRTAVAIEELSFGDKVWVTAALDSLEPLRSVRSLRRLSFAIRKIGDGRIQPLAALERLEQLECPSNLFTTEQLAWLRARLPDATQGRVLLPIQEFDRTSTFASASGSVRDVLVMGKRKPFLDSQADAARIARYVDNYWKLVAQFRADRSLEPTDL